MKIIGIIAEYNPFHNGHLYQLQKSVQETGADGVIAIMSGNFVQRGHPAIFDKWTRTKMALSAGVNLVIELPTFYATASAEQFAYGAVKLLNDTNVVSSICFGSENIDLDAFTKIACILANEPKTFKDLLSYHLAKGLSYPSARAEALKTYLNIESVPSMSNSILGIEYIKALIQLKSNISPFMIQRIGKGYHDSTTDSTFSSATAIRKAYFNLIDDCTDYDISEHVPLSCSRLIDSLKPPPVRMEDFENVLLYILRTTPVHELAQYREVTEGLEHKLKTLANKVSNYQDLVDGLKSKRYARTKITRMLINILLQIKGKDHDIDTLNYLRVLGFDETGQKILKQIKNNSDLSIITNMNHINHDLKANTLLQLDQKSSDIYTLAHKSHKDRFGAKDLIEPIIRR